MKRYIIILIALSMIFSLPASVFAEENAAPGYIKLNLEQSYKLMETNNLEIKLLDKKIEIKEKQFEDVLDAADEARRLNKSNTSFQHKRTEVITPKLEWLEVEALKNDRSDKLDSLKSAVKKQYVNVLLLQEDVAYITDDISVMDKRLQEVQLRIKLGQAKDSEYKTLYSQKLSVQNQLNLLNVQLESAMINLKMLLGVDFAQQVTLEKITLPYQVVNRETLKSDMIKSIDNSFIIYKLNKEITLKNDEIEMYKDYNRDYKYSPDYKDLSIELSEMEAELNYEKLNTEADLWIEYYNLMVLEDDIKLQEVNLEIEKINYESIVTKAKLGMVDSVTEMNAKISYNRQQTTRQRAMYDYIIAVEQFNDKLK